MRMTPLVMLVLAAALPAAESPRAFPLWDGHESVADYAKRVNLPPTETLDLGEGVKLELVLVPAGKFIMGSPLPDAPKETVEVGQNILAVAGAVALGLILAVAIQAVRKRKRPQFSLRYLLGVALALSVASYGGVRWHKTTLAWQEYQVAQARYDAADKHEKPAHPVTITKPFYAGKFQVTQAQYQAVMNTNPSEFKGPDNPVVVSWNETQAFCKKLTEQTKQAVRLPTEAEWEYACRAGTKTTYHSGDTEADLSRVAWYEANSNSTPHPVGQKEANRFGLYDMHGNVWQWCQDKFSLDYYEKSETENPQGPAEGKVRSVRGGSAGYWPWYCRSSFRNGYPPGAHYGNVGFRVVLVPAFKTP